MGKGYFANGQFHLYVSFRYPTDPGESDVWHEVFREVSRIFEDATRGVHSIGRVLFSDNSAGGNDADVWIMDDLSQSHSDFARIWILENHMQFQRREASIPSRLAHELCHYLYGLGDEYVIDSSEVTVNRCQRSPNTEFCFMEHFDLDRYTRWGPTNGRPSFYLDWKSFYNDFQARPRQAVLYRGMPTRFCYAGDNPGIGGCHDPNNITRQNTRSNKQSCWEYMVNDANHNNIPYGL